MKKGDILFLVAGKILLVAAVVYPLIVFSLFPRFVVDDAYITFRYAENLALHGELNWNVGEDPVEGYTGVALPVILAGFITVGVDPAVASRGIGIFSFWLGFLMLFLIGRRMRLALLFIASILFLYATTPILFTHAVGGMETMLFVAALLASAWAFISKKDTALLVLLLLTSLIRPEGVAFSAYAFIAAGWGRHREGRAEFQRFAVRFLVIYFLPALAYFLWRFNYYGELLPNTFYAKSGFGFQFGAVADIARFLRRFFAVPVLAGLFVWLPAIDWLAEKRKELSLVRPVSLLGAVLLFCVSVTLVLSTSHLIANFSHRLYMPLFGALVVGLVVFFAAGYDAFACQKETRPRQYTLASMLFLALVLYQGLFQTVKLKDEFHFAKTQVVLHEYEHNRIGQTLRTIIPPQETLAVYMDAGAIPYFSQLPTIDFGKLNDEYLARQKRSPEEVADYFYAHQPGVAVFTSVAADRVESSEEVTVITADPRFKDYVLFKKYLFPSPDVRYHEFVYLRKDLYGRLAKEGKI